MNRESAREQLTKRRVLMCVVGEWKGVDFTIDFKAKNLESKVLNKMKEILINNSR